MALVDSGLNELANAVFGGKLRNYGRTDAEMDERADARIADKLNLKIPNTWDGHALAACWAAPIATAWAGRTYGPDRGEADVAQPQAHLREDRP